MKLLAAILLLVCCSARAVIVLPSTADMDSTNWTALAHRLNGSGSAITNHVSYRFVMRLSSGYLACAVGSNKVAYAAHVGTPTTVWFDDVNDVGHTTYTVSSVSASGDFAIATLSDVLPRWASVNTNSLMGSNVIAWGQGKGFNTNGTVSTNFYRVFPLTDVLSKTRWGPMQLYSLNPATSSNYRLITDSSGTNNPTAAVGGDSSGPLFFYNTGTANWQFVGNWNGSEASGDTVEDFNTQIANATYTANSFLAGQLPDFTGYDPQPGGGSGNSTNSPATNIRTLRLR